MKKNKFDVFTVSRTELLEGLHKMGIIDLPANFEEMIEFEPLDNSGHCTFIFAEHWLKWEKPTGKTRAELKIELENVRNVFEETRVKYKRGEITATEYMFIDNAAFKGFKFVSLDEEGLLGLIHKIKFPSFMGSFYKPEAWVEPGVGQKLSKAEVTDNGIEFTVEQVPVP
ncbi:hypothetical protein ACFLS8_02220 [Chloroflexota bacterium]